MSDTILAREFLQEMFSIDWMTPSEIDTIVTAMNLYAKGKCKEQRELCSHALTADIPKSPTHNLVLYAPEPKFDLPETQKQ